MSLLTEQQLDQLASKVKQAEQQTSAELVTVLAEKADDYLFIPTLWAAVVALLTPILLSLSPFWLEQWELFAAQVSIFAVLALVFRLPVLLYRLVPKKVKHHRAAMLARKTFLDQGLHLTTQRTGVLIFVSEAEHYVEILVDQGVAEKIDNQVWADIIQRFTQAVTRGETLSGFQTCIEEVTHAVSEQLPQTSSHNQNELNDRLVLI